VTKVQGSFLRTLDALRILGDFKSAYDFEVALRLLFSRQTAFENPAIVRFVRQELGNIDTISLNRLILSDTAKSAESTISWDAARVPINQSARLARRFGFNLVAGSIPLCVLDDDNLAFVINQRPSIEPASETKYFDIAVAEGRLLKITSVARRAIPDVCLRCDLRSACSGVEDWYYELFGHKGLSTRRMAELE
jgi:hypothetical protein